MLSAASDREGVVRPLPSELVDVIDRATAADPSARHPDVDALYDALQAVVSGRAFSEWTSDVPTEEPEDLDGAPSLDFERREVVPLTPASGRDARRWALLGGMGAAVAAGLVVVALVAAFAVTVLAPAPAPQVAVELRCLPVGAAVHDDGAVVAVCPTTLLFDGESAPPRRIDVTAPGYTSERRMVGPADRVVEVALQPADAAQVVAEPASP